MEEVGRTKALQVTCVGTMCVVFAVLGLVATAEVWWTGGCEWLGDSVGPEWGANSARKASKEMGYIRFISCLLVDKSRLKREGCGESGGYGSVLRVETTTALIRLTYL